MKFESKQIHQLQGTNDIEHLATCSYMTAGPSGALVHRWDQARIGELIVGLGLRFKIISHKFLVRDAAGPEVSRAHGLTSHRH